MRRHFIIAVTALLALTAVPADAVDVNLDPTFSGTGKGYVGARASLASAVETHGGDVYVAGIEYFDDRRRGFVIRLDSSGEVDPTFGSDGRRTFRVHGKYALYAAMSIAADGGIVVVVQSNASILVVRLTSSGAVDSSFSNDGRRYLTGEGSPIYLPPDSAIDSQGRIVVGAMDRTKTGADVRIWRLLADGALDPTWSTDGVRTIDTQDAGDDWIDTLAIDAKDRVLVGTDHVDSPAIVHRFRANGSPDPSFSGDGQATFRLAPGAWTFPVGIEVDGSGLITVAAAGFDNSRYGAARLTPSGELDPSYGDGGVVSVGCRTSCYPLWGDVEGGKVAVVVEPYGRSDEDGSRRVARISHSGNGVRVLAVDAFTKTKSESIEAIDIDGAKTLIVGSGQKRAYVARIP